MHLSIESTPATTKIVEVPGSTTITIEGLDDGEVRRFRRIVESFNARVNEGADDVYRGNLTSQFAAALAEAVRNQ